MLKREGQHYICQVTKKYIKHFQLGDMWHLTENALSGRFFFFFFHFQNVYDVQSINIISPRDYHHFAKVKLSSLPNT